MIEKILDWMTSGPATLISGIFLGASLLTMLMGWQPIIDPVFVTLTISGIPLAYWALTKLLKRRMISSGLLVTTAMVACMALKEYFAAGEVAFIMTLGELLEDFTLKRAKHGLLRLISIEPVTCRRLSDAGESMVSVADIRCGDRIRIQPGEMIPVDGDVLSGETSVDQSAITGESLPVDKHVGDSVVSGSLNCFGVIDICATKIGEDSSIQKLIRMVREAELKKAPTQRIVDRWAKWLIPTAMLIAIITFLVTGDVLRAVTVLVVFCPCALVLATPTAIVAAIGQAAKHGVLIKSGEALENMGRTNLLAFDKTGTLTYGRLDVSDVVPLQPNLSGTALVALAASGESQSGHPLAKAIVAYAHTQRIAFREPDTFKMTSGKGLTITQDGATILCGNEKFLTENAIVIPPACVETVAQLRHVGKAVVLVARNGELAGAIGLSDVLRPEAKTVVARLRALGADVALLSGDHATAATHVAEQAGITRIHAELLPAEKEQAIEAFQAAGKTVCMVGDGINDAPALKTARVGVAMGTIGSDIAIEAADIALVGDDLSRIPYVKALSNATIHAITFNITLSMCINVIAITLSVLGFLGPVSGALIHNAGSILVVLNAALLYDRKF